MRASRFEVKPPEPVVCFKFFLIGFALTEIIRLARYLGHRTASVYPDQYWLVGVVGLLCMAVVLVYAWQRQVNRACRRLLKSGRIDLAFFLVAGFWANLMLSPAMAHFHAHFQKANPLWAPMLELSLVGMLLFPLANLYAPAKQRPSQLLFMGDDEIDKAEDDALATREHAKAFAETVLASAANQGLVFGIDGPWGVGKTSFTKLAECHWRKTRAQALVVFRFELLRYATEPDLPQRFMRELSTALQKQVFVPEFTSLTSRYLRSLKGKAEFSLFGLKYSLEPSEETIDDTLEDIDEVLLRLGRRVIIIIDDLDRLDAAAVNNVLFTIRRTFRLSQATYILCYDTEVLAGADGDGANARAFLEKFVTVKHSLFVDTSMIKRFLLRDWSSEKNALQTIPSDTMLKLASVLGELAETVNGPLAASYMPLLGDLRKIKRFVNAVLLMQIDRTELANTDFHRRDLIHLALLHLHFPGVFRQIYVEETEGRTGSFAVFRARDNARFANSPTFGEFLRLQSTTIQFLLTQLFDVHALGLNTRTPLDEALLSSRACFNQDGYRNLEKYLKLIVRFLVPEPTETFVLYQRSIDRVKNETSSIKSILNEPAFRITSSDTTHDQFWSLLVNQASNFTASVANDAIRTLVDYLPHYSSVRSNGTSLRERSIYSLIRLLDLAGWGRTSVRRLANTPAAIAEVAHRIFGTQAFAGQGVLDQIVEPARGVLGWRDLMLFRLPLSWDRGSQLYNVQSSLLLYENPEASTTGHVSELAVQGMRRLSQEIFARFRRTYIETGQNFFAEVAAERNAAFFGDSLAKAFTRRSRQKDEEARELRMALDASRTALTSFVVYQLSNSGGATGDGIGCGYYDEAGSDDARGIAKCMNDYVFKVCFDPVNQDNLHHFVDYCLSHLSNALFAGGDGGYVATASGLVGGFDPERLAQYWRTHGDVIKGHNLHTLKRTVTTYNYTATYAEDLPKAFAALDAFVETLPLPNSG